MILTRMSVGLCRFANRFGLVTNPAIHAVDFKSSTPHQNMKKALLSPSFYAGVFLTIGVILPGHMVFNRENHIKCLEHGRSHRLVSGTSFLGDTNICVHVGYLN